MKSIQLFRKSYQKKRKEMGFYPPIFRNSLESWEKIEYPLSLKLLLLKNICLQPFQLSPKLQVLLGIDQLAIPEGKIKRMLTRTCLNQDWISNQFLIYVTTYSYGLSGTREAKKYWVGKTLIFTELLGISNFLGFIIDVFILFVWILGAHPLPGSLIMVRWVVEFQTRVSKTSNVFAWKSTFSKEILISCKQK